MKKSAVAVMLSTVLIAPAVAQQFRTSEDQRAIVHYQEGWERLAREAWAEAAREFQAAIEINREYKLAYYGLGRAQIALKHYADAINAYEQCRNLYTAQAGRNLSNKVDAEILLRDDIAQIDTALQRLQASGSQSPQTLARIADLQSQKQRYQLRSREIQNISLSSPVPPFVSLALGSAYFRAERFADAEREYKATIQADPSTGEAHSNLAVLYLTTGRYRDADLEVRAAEKVGFKVHPQLKQDIRDRMR